jgi:Tol biopolymer transport system component
MNADGSGLQTIPTHGRVTEMVISPDGQSVAYISSDDTGASGFEVFVLNLNGTDKKKIVANPRKNDKEVSSQSISWSPWL